MAAAGAFFRGISTVSAMRNFQDAPLLAGDAVKTPAPISWFFGLFSHLPGVNQIGEV